MTRRQSCVVRKHRVKFLWRIRRLTHGESAGAWSRTAVVEPSACERESRFGRTRYHAGMRLQSPNRAAFEILAGALQGF